MKKTLGTMLKARREAMGLSQRALARELDVKASHVGYLEGGRRRPSLALLGRIANVLALEREPLFLLAYPEAKEFLNAHRPESNCAATRGEAWRNFIGNKALIRRHSISRRELKVLRQVNMLGRITSPRHFLFVLNSIRQAVEEE